MQTKFIQTVFDIWERPDFDAKRKLAEFYNKHFHLNLDFLTVTLMREITTVIRENHHFDN